MSSGRLGACLSDFRTARQRQARTGLRSFQSRHWRRRRADVFASPPPGVYLAEPESKSRRIVIDQVRALEHALQMRSTDGRRKVAIVAEADRLQPQAANAFLKTLEEPPNDSLLLLLSSMPEVLPGHDPFPLHRRSAGRRGESGAFRGGERNWWNCSAASPAPKGEGSAARLSSWRGVSTVCSRRCGRAIQDENAAALKRDEMRYNNTTDGAWLDEREDYYKALTESQYMRAAVAGWSKFFFSWWSDVLRASTGVARRESARRESKQTERSGRAADDLRKFCAGFGVWRKCATISAATSRKRSPSKWRFSASSRFDLSAPRPALTMRSL